AGGHGAVADHRDDIVVPAREIAGDGHAEARGNRGRGMSGAEGIVFAFGALRETGQSAALAERADAVAAAGQYLVGIGLMADVPYDAVFRRVEDVVERDGEFDDAETGAEMTACLRHRIDHFRPQLVRDLLQVSFGK